MRSFYLFGLASLFLVLMACKQDATTQSEGSSREATQTQQPQATPGDQGSSGQTASSAAGGGHDYTFLTDKILLYRNSFGPVKEGEDQPYKDQWIDLMPDGTFKAGKLKEQTHTGTWTYNHDTKVLFIKPNDTSYKMSEWSVMANNQMMVWVGTQTYGDNAVQIQVVWSDQLP